MEFIKNPFTPGAGYPPPELAGRDQIRRDIHASVSRLKAGKHAKNVVMVGLRGVGKTVLLERALSDSEKIDGIVVRAEVQEGRSLPGVLVPELRRTLLQLDRTEHAKHLVGRALHALAGFAKMMKFNYNDIEMRMELEFEPDPGLADSGDIDADLPNLLLHVGEAAQASHKVLIISLDEAQYIDKSQMSALIAGVHRCAHKQLPVMMIAAGLPQLRAAMGSAKSYAERLFEYPTVGALSPEDAARAIRNPIENEGAKIDQAAIDLIVKETEGYPYFLQEWGKHVWDIAPKSPITVNDVMEAEKHVRAKLDESFFRVRFDRLRPTEKQYLRAMAHLMEGTGDPPKSSEVADVLNQPMSKLSPIRNGLLEKGMLHSPVYSVCDFTVPAMDRYMRQMMPGDDWRTPSSPKKIKVAGLAPGG